jgi:iron complex outermembrane receptor protein
VINIITRSAFDTPGGKVALSTGTERRAYGFARYGWNPDPDTAVQLHAKAHDYDTSKRLDGGKAVDDWQNQSAGFKLERLLEKGTLQVQGGVFSSHAGDEVTMLGVNPMPFMTPTLSEQKIHGGHLMARWEFDQSKTGGKSLQVFVDQSDYQHVILNEKRLNLDLEYQQRWAAGSHHDLIWGLGYRRSSDRIGNSSMLVIDESKRTSQIFSAYLQDEITLQPERWRLSLGARLEHNQHTGLEFQPNARLLWTPTEKTSGWMSVARAVRTPSRIEQGATVYVQADPAGMPAYNVPPSIVATRVAGMQEEKLDAFDIGWRHQFNPTTSLDLAAFHYKYKELRGSALTTPSFMPPGYLLIVAPVNNAQSATTNGIEATLDWRPRSDWRLQASLSRLNVSVPNLPLPELASDVDKVSPTNQIGLRSSLDLSSTLKWDAWLRHVGRIEYYGVPAFTTLDMRLAWQATKNLEVALVGQNLLDKDHPEYGSQFITSPLAAIERSVYVKLDWKF